MTYLDKPARLGDECFGFLECRNAIGVVGLVVDYEHCELGGIHGHGL